MSTPHTPGPWLANVDTVWRGGEPIVCHPINSARSIADARLIAAAPDLLAALRGLLQQAATLDQSATHEGLANCYAIATARAAIAKAEGGAE